MRNTPWQLCRPPVRVETARRLGDVRHAIAELVLESLGHAELLGCLRAAGAALEECVLIAMRDVDRTRIAEPKKRPIVPKKKRSTKAALQRMENVEKLLQLYKAGERKRAEAAKAENVSRKKRG